MGSYVAPELYRQFHAAMPVLCVETIILREGKALLLRRLREPAQGQLWFPGGPLRRGDDFEETAHRIAHEEAGIWVSGIRFVGIDNVIFPEDPFGHGRGTHAPTLLFRCEPQGVDQTVKVDVEHSGYAWNDGSSPDLDPHVARFIRLARETGRG